MIVYKIKGFTPGSENLIALGRHVGAQLVAALKASGLPAMNKRLHPAPGSEIFVNAYKFFDKWMVDLYLSFGGGILYFLATPALPAKRRALFYTAFRIMSWQTGYYHEQTGAQAYSRSGISAMEAGGAIAAKVPWDYISDTVLLGGGVFALTQTFINVPNGMGSMYVDGVPSDGSMYFIQGYSFYQNFPYTSENNTYAVLAYNGAKSTRYVMALEDGTVVVSDDNTAYYQWQPDGGWAGGSTLWIRRYDQDNYPAYTRKKLTIDVPLDVEAPTEVCGYQGEYADPAWAIKIGQQYELPAGKQNQGVLLQYGWNTLQFVSYKQVIPGTNPVRYNYYRWLAQYDYTQGRKGGEILVTGTDQEGGTLLSQTAEELAIELGMDPAYSRGLFGDLTYVGGDPYAAERAVWYEERATKPIERDRLWRKQLSDEDKTGLIAGTLSARVFQALTSLFPASENHVASGNLVLSWDTAEEGSAPPVDVVHTHPIASYRKTTTKTLTIEYDSPDPPLPGQERKRVKKEVVGTRVDDYVRHVLHPPSGGSTGDYTLGTDYGGLWTIETTYVNYPVPGWNGPYGEAAGPFVLNGSSYERYGSIYDFSSDLIQVAPGVEDFALTAVPASLRISGRLTEWDVPLKYRTRTSSSTFIPLSECFVGTPAPAASTPEEIIEYRSIWKPRYTSVSTGEEGGGTGGGGV